MTKVTYMISDEGFCIECEGHSSYAEAGKDIVCAGISTLIQTLIDYTECFAHIKPGYVYCEGKGSYKSDYANFVIHGLNLIAANYPDNLKVVQGCPRNNNLNLK